MYPIRWLCTLLPLLLTTACTLDRAAPLTVEQAEVDYDILLSLPNREVGFRDQVQPVLERRCVVCHGCYDAPCQLKFSAPEGIQRGASKALVYDGARIRAADPTRLFVDAQSTQEWRDKGFFAVIDESASADPAERLRNSVMYRMLRLKQRHPQPRVGMLPDSLDVGLDRKQVCPTLPEMADFEQRYPDWGMPYALPNLSDREYRTLVQWLAQGAKVSAAPLPSAASARQVRVWERFLNGDSLKQRLVSRYLYEHLFAGHLHFDGAPPREFFRLVRSTTPPGEPIAEIATLRPYDDPGVDVFYYRLRPYAASVVAKTHVVYPLSDARLRRLRALFLEPDCAVSGLPSYQPLIASNPFKAFAELPVVSRYRFLLDDARYFVEGFVKGPVCRGQVALNVVEDQFWVAFLDPEHDEGVLDPSFLPRVADDLQMPSAEGDDPSLLRVFSVEREYTERENRYVRAKMAYYDRVPRIELSDAMAYVWDGGDGAGGRNPNAALTVFRHLDSGSVSYGFVGDYPETAWVIDYPLLERIHYLLVAGFNVYGNLNHQLNTRLFMDFLRMEGEDHFLAFLPAEARKSIRDSWYQGIREGLDQRVGSDEWLSVEPVYGYRSQDPQRELYRQLIAHLGPAASSDDFLARCSGGVCERTGATAAERRVDQAMRRIAAMHGEQLRVFADLSFVRVRLPGGGRTASSGLGYTLIRNKAYKSVSSLLDDETRRAAADLANDTLTVVPWLEGSYPNFFFDVGLEDIDAFADAYLAINDRDDYERFVGLYGVRRSSDQFWAIADWFYKESAIERPVAYGLFDLNRYRNR